MELSKNKRKYIRSLQQKKYRQKYNKFVAEGDKIVSEILAAQHSVEFVVATPDWLDNYTGPVPNAEIFTLPIEAMRKASDLSTTQGVLAVVDLMPVPELPKPGWTIFLDDIQDPGNAGTILRIADWFGVSQVVFSNQSADLYNAKVIQASMGAFLRVPVWRSSLAAFRQKASDVPVYAAHMEGTSIFELSNPQPGILVVGNEGHGLTPDIKEQVDQFISIPRGPGGGAESLNAGVATGIIISQLIRYEV
jgi:TrmH family RNA methyltransferase